MQDCGHCSYQNPEGAKFCQQCGYPLIPPAPSPLAQTAYPEQVSQMPTPKKGLTYFEKWALVGSVLVIILIIGVFASMSANPSRTAPIPPPPSKSWHYVTNYTGTYEVTPTTGSYDNRRTSLFDIRGTQFRLLWRFTPTPYDATTSSFNFLVYPQGTTTRYIAFLCLSGSFSPNIECNQFSTTSGTEYVPYGPGSFYFKILIGNLVQWSITVEDYY